MLSKRKPETVVRAQTRPELRGEPLGVDFDLGDSEDGYFEELLVSNSLSKATTQESSPLADDKVGQS